VNGASDVVALRAAYAFAGKVAGFEELFSDAGVCVATSLMLLLLKLNSQKLL
jgi:hypothetical protein